jgi:NAD(P)H dehydrogenase (quinone)
VRTATFADAAASRAALEGVDLLLMVSGAEARDRLQQHRTFVDAAASAGVRHVVYTSFMGAAEDATFTLGRDHWATEEAIRATDMAHTFLRDSFYLDFVEDLVGEDGVIRGPAGDGAMAAVARADVARVATAVLRDPAAHLDRTYDLTGPAAITLAEAASIVSAARGRAVRYQPETLEEAYASRARWNPEPWQADAWVSTYTAIAEGALARVTGDVERVTGRAPMSLEDVLRAG